MQNLRVLLELLHMEAKLRPDYPNPRNPNPTIFNLKKKKHKSRPHESQVQDTKKERTRTCRVIADFQLSVYYLCDLDTGLFLGMAYIPTDKISMMDRLFTPLDILNAEPFGSASLNVFR